MLKENDKAAGTSLHIFHAFFQQKELELQKAIQLPLTLSDYLHNYLFISLLITLMLKFFGNIDRPVSSQLLAS